MVRGSSASVSQPLSTAWCLYLHMATLTTQLAKDLDKAFPAFVASHQDAVFSTARGLATNHHDAEDIAQEAFVRAYRALQTWEPERIRELHARAWLAQIVVNLCRNAARTKSRRPATRPLDSAPAVVSESAGPESLFESYAALSEWRSRLAVIPAAEATAVVLRHIYELSYREISEVTGVPQGTAKARVHRGIEKLRELTEEQDV